METDIQQTIAPLVRARNWIKLVGIGILVQSLLAILNMAGNMAQGTQAAINLIGLIAFGLPLWAGGLLYGFSNRIRHAADSSNAAEAQTALDKLSLAFRLLGIFALLALLAFVLAMLAAIALPAIIKAREAAGQM
jgi:hypothetical protein